MCNEIHIVTAHTVISCTVGEGTGHLNVSVTVAGQTASFRMYYQGFMFTSTFVT